MADVRKLSASAGAEWLLGGMALLRRSPFGLGLLGVIYGLIAWLASASAERDMSLFLVLELALVLLGPVLVGGMVYAAREVDRGADAVPAHLWRGLRDGKGARLLATLLPQVAALLACVVLLVAMVGPGELVQLADTMEKLQGQAKPDPALVALLPLRRLMWWLLLAFAIGIVAGFFTFAAVPEIMFTDSGAFAAMKRSFRACLRNLPALAVFIVLAVIASIAFYVVLAMVGLLARAVAGPAAMQVAVQLLLMAVLMPVVTGAMYTAWKQMLGDGEAAAVASPPSGIEA